MPLLSIDLAIFFRLTSDSVNQDVTLKLPPRSKLQIFLQISDSYQYLYFHTRYLKASFVLSSTVDSK